MYPDEHYHFCAEAPKAERTDDLGPLSPAEVQLVKDHRQAEVKRLAYNCGVQDCIDAVRALTQYQGATFVPRPVQPDELVAALRHLRK
jgi:hypothetical protein